MCTYLVALYRERTRGMYHHLEVSVQLRMLPQRMICHVCPGLPPAQLSDT